MLSHGTTSAGAGRNDTLYARLLGSILAPPCPKYERLIPLFCPPLTNAGKCKHPTNGRGCNRGCERNRRHLTGRGSGESVVLGAGCTIVQAGVIRRIASQRGERSATLLAPRVLRWFTQKVHPCA